MNQPSISLERMTKHQTRRKRILENVCNLSRPGALTKFNVLTVQADIADLIFSSDEEDVNAGIAAQRLLTDRIVMARAKV